MPKYRLSELVFDFDLYPRTAIDSTHVSSMREAERAGVTFPPYVICRASKRVVDGFHRGRKDRLEHGNDCEVECIEKDYDSDGDLFLDAMRYNASHGRRLTPFDRARCAMKCKRFRVGETRIAEALGMTRASLKAIGEGRTALFASEGGTKEMTLKRTISHLAGATLTESQRAANAKLSGMNQGFIVNQLLLLIRNDLVDKSDEIVMISLRDLHSALESFFVMS